MARFVFPFSKNFPIAIYRLELDFYRLELLLLSREPSHFAFLFILHNDRAGQ